LGPADITADFGIRDDRRVLVEVVFSPGRNSSRSVISSVTTPACRPSSNPPTQPIGYDWAAGAVLFGSTLTAAETAQLNPTAVRGSYDTVVAALVAAVADDRLPVARLRAAAPHVALAAHDNLCD